MHVTGGIINGSSGSITAGEWGIAVVYETQFTGGIVNNAGGKITAGTAAGTPDSGINVDDVSTLVAVSPMPAASTPLGAPAST